MTDSISAAAGEQQQPGSGHSAFGGPTDPAAGADTQRLVTLLTQQRDIYQQLQALSGTQSQLVDSGSSEPLLAILAQRQQLIDELARLHSEMEPFRRRWEQVYGGLSGAQKEEVADLVKQVEGLLTAIIDQDNRDRQQLEDARTQVGGELTRMAHAGAASAAYHVQRSSGQSAGSGVIPLTDRHG